MACQQQMELLDRNRVTKIQLERLKIQCDLKIFPWNESYAVDVRVICMYGIDDKWILFDILADF